MIILNDFDIIELYFLRNEQAIVETDNKYGRLCHKLAINIVKNSQDAEECVNDTYMGAWNSIPPTRPNNFMAFLCKITRNVSLKRLNQNMRKKRSHGVMVSFDELAEILPDKNIADGISDEHVGKLISDFLRNEKQDVRNVFIRKYFFFDNITDIARRYNFTKSKIKNMLHHTRTKLKDYLIKEGVEL